MKISVLFFYFIRVFFIALLLASDANANNNTAAHTLPMPKFKAGQDYVFLASAKQSLKTKTKITVIEFFSYDCPACFTLEPALEKWLLHQSSHISFKRVPVSFEPTWEMYAKSYLALSYLNRDAQITPYIFKAVYVDRLALFDKNIMASFLNHYGIDRKIFLNLFDSSLIEKKLSENKKLINNSMVFQVPAIIINEKYKTDPSLAGASPERLLAIVDELIAKEKEN